MDFKTLIQLSKTEFDSQPNQIKRPISLNIFNAGAKWMFDKLNQSELNDTLEFDERISYSFYGVLKYVLSLSFFTLSLVLAWEFNKLLMPFTILVFYLVEVHFLFLFPLLLDKVSNPISTSIRQTYRIGLMTTALRVLQIGVFMLVGIMNFTNPFRNWHIGCLAILLWYKNEIRDRV